MVDIDAMFSSFAPYELFDKFEIEEYYEKHKVDAEPVKHGKWTWNSWHCKYKCSECGGQMEVMSTYCPWCGARMDIKKT